MTDSVETLRRRFEQKPSEVASFRALQTHWLEKNDFASLIDIYQARAEAVEPIESAELYLTIAEKWAPETRDADKVTQAYQRALDKLTVHSPLRETLREQLWKRGRWVLLGQMLQRDVELASRGEERGRALLELARFLVFKLDQKAAAATAFVNAFVELDALGSACLEELERLANDNPDEVTVAGALERLYRDLGHHQAFYDRLVGRLDKGLIQSDTGQLDVLLDAARVAGRDLNQWNKAAEHLNRAADDHPQYIQKIRKCGLDLQKLAPDSVEIFGFVADISERTGDWDNAIGSLHRLTQLESDAYRRGLLHMRLGEILSAKLHRPGDAIEHFETAGETDPAYQTEAIEKIRIVLESMQKAEDRAPIERRLQAALERSGDFDGLVSILKSKLAEEKDDAQRLQLLFELGDLHLRRMNLPDKALDFYGEACGLAKEKEAVDTAVSNLFALLDAGVRPDETTAFIEKTCRASQRWDDLLRLESHRLELAQSNEQRAQILLRMGEMLESNFAQPEAAIKNYKKAAELAPKQRQFVRTLRNALKRHGRCPEALTYYQHELSQIEDQAEKVLLAAEMADLLWTDLAEPVVSLRVMLEWFDLESPSTEIAKQLVTRLSDPKGRQALQSLIEMTQDTTLESMPVDLLATKVTTAILAEHTGSIESWHADVLLAIEHFIVLEPSTESRLIEYLNTNHRFKDVADILERRAERQGSTEAARAAWSELAALCVTKLKDPQREIATYWTWTQRFPEDWSALSTFVSRLAELGQTEPLSELVQQLDGRIGDEAVRPEYTKILSVYADYQCNNLKRDDLAAVTYARLVRLDPLNSNALQFLEEYYNQAEDALAYYEVLSASVADIVDEAERSRRHRHLADIADDRLQEPSLAEAHWTSILDIPKADRPTTEHAISCLRELYSDESQSEELIAVVQTEIELFEAPKDRAKYLLELVGLFEGLGRFEEALAKVDELITATPGDIELLERAAELAFQLDDPEREALYTKKIVELGPERVDARLRLVRILVDQLSEPQKAIEELKAATELNPGNTLALDTAEEVYAELDRLDEYQKLLRSQVDVAPNSEVRVTLLLRLAHSADVVPPSEKDWKAWAYRRILEEVPDRNDIAASLAHHFEDHLKWDEAIEVLQGLVEKTEAGPERNEIDRRIGSIIEHHLGDLPGAKKAYLKVLDANPDDAGALRALLRIAEEQEEHDEVVRITRCLTTAEPDATDLHQLVLRAGRLAEEEIDDPESAAALFGTAVEQDPLDRETLTRLVDLQKRTENWNALTETLNRLSGLAEDDPTRVDLWMRRAKVFEEKLEDLESAAGCYEDLLLIQPANRLALHAIKRVYISLERWTDVLAILGRLVQLDADPVIRVATLREAAEIHEQHLGTTEESAKLHRLAHQLLAEDETTLNELKRLAESYGHWQPYVEVLRENIDRANSSEQQVVRLLECATVVNEKLLQSTEAISLLYTRFDAHPERGPLFEKICEIATEHARWDMLENGYERLIRATLEPRLKVELFWELADILIDPGENPDEAFRLLTKAYVTQPSNRATIDRMETIAEEHTLWTQYDEFLKERWSDALDLSEKLELLMRRGELLEVRLDQLDDALDQKVMAFQLDPFNREIEAELYRFAEVNGYWDTVIKLFELMANERSELKLKTHLLSEMARISEKYLEQPDQAFELIARAWRLDPTDPALHQSLVDHARGTNRLSDLASAFEWAANHATDPSQELADWLRLADFSWTELADFDKAIRSLSEAFRIDPMRTETLDTLEALFEEREDGKQLLRVLTKWVPAARNPKERANLFRRIAKNAADLNLVNEAIEAYRGVLSIDPKDLSALDGLAKLHRATGDLDRVVRCLNQGLKSTSSPDDRKRILRELCDCYVELEQFDSAIASLEQLIRQFPDDDRPFQRLVELYLKVGRQEDAVGTLELLASELSGEEAMNALLIAAEISAVQLDDPKRAARFCTRATRIDPTNREALRLGADLAGVSGRWQDQVDTFLALADLETSTIEPDSSGDVTTLLTGIRDTSGLRKPEDLQKQPAPNSRVVYLGAAALVLETRLLHPARATAMWENVAAETPDWVCVPLHLARIASAKGDAKSAESHLQRAARILGEQSNTDALSQIYELLEALLENDPARLADALGACEMALVADAQNEKMQRRYQELINQSNDLPRSRRFFEKLLEQELSSSQRRAVLLILADNLRDLGEAEKTKNALEEAAELEGDDPQVRAALASLANREGDYKTAMELYTELLEEKVSPIVPVTLHKGLALAAEGAGDLEMANEHYSNAHAIAPEDAEVLLGLARIALRREALALAELYVQEALEKDTGNLGLQNQAKLVQADILITRGEQDAAVAILQSMVGAEGEIGQQAQEKLVRHYLNEGLWGAANDALAQLDKIIPAGPKRTALLTQRAEILQTRLGSREAAFDVLTKLLAAEPDSPEIRLRSAALAVELERWESAVELAEPMVPQLRDPTELADCRRLLGRAKLALGQPEEARSHFSTALRLDPSNTKALEGLIEAARRQEDWSRLVHELKAHLARAGDQGAALRGVTLRALAEIFTGPLLDQKAALDTYGELATLFPEDPSIHSAQLALFVDLPTVDTVQYAESLSKLAGLGQIDLNAVRDLKRRFIESGNADRAYVLTELLILCDAASSDEIQHFSRMVFQTPPFDTGWVLDELALEESIRFAPCRSELISCLVTASNSVSRSNEPLSADLTEHALTERFSITSRALAFRTARLLTAPPGQPTAIFLASEPTVLVEPSELEGLSDEAIQFELAVWAAQCRPEHIMSFVLQGFDYVSFHEAAIDSILSDEAISDRDEKMAEAVRFWQDRFRQDASDFDTQPAITSADGVGRDEIVGPLQWTDSARFTCSRLGLIACGSLSVAVQQLIVRDYTLAGRRVRSVEDLTDLMSSSQDIKQLIAFVLSPAFGDVRDVFELAQNDYVEGEGLLEPEEPDSLDFKDVTEFELEIEGEALSADIRHDTFVTTVASDVEGLPGDDTAVTAVEDVDGFSPDDTAVTEIPIEAEEVSPDDTVVMAEGRLADDGADFDEEEVEFDLDLVSPDDTAVTEIPVEADDEEPPKES